MCDTAAGAVSLSWMAPHFTAGAESGGGLDRGVGQARRPSRQSKGGTLGRRPASRLRNALKARAQALPFLAIQHLVQARRDLYDVGMIEVLEANCHCADSLIAPAG